MSFDERSHRIIAFAVKSFDSIGREGSKPIDQLATGVAGRRDRGAMPKKCICKERLVHILAVASQVAS